MSKISSTIAKTEDGTIQITFNIPYPLIETAKRQAALALGKDIEIAGFRKGKAPLDKVLEKIPQNTLVEKILTQLLPTALAEAIKKHKIKPAVYPKFELISTGGGKDWQIRAVTCELPEVDLGDYKKVVQGALRTSSSSSKDEKEQLVIKTLLDSIKVKVPNILVDEEVNVRLSNLLERIEKLGLSLDGYLASVGRNPQSLRAEYENQARQLIALELILNKIADEQNIKIPEKQVDDAISASKADPKLAEKLQSPRERELIQAVLKRRAVLDSLVSLI